MISVLVSIVFQSINMVTVLNLLTDSRCHCEQSSPWSGAYRYMAKVTWCTKNFTYIRIQTFH